eukprot:8004798-Alexandrium_andersonii.AAC.1
MSSSPDLLPVAVDRRSCITGQDGPPSISRTTGADHPRPGSRSALLAMAPVPRSNRTGAGMARAPSLTSSAAVIRLGIHRLPDLYGHLALWSKLSGAPKSSPGGR